MKKMSLIAVFLALILILASCTKKKEEEPTKESSPPTAGTETKEPVSEEQLPGLDLQEGYETPIIFRN